MADTAWKAVNDTLKGIAGVVGIEVAKTAETISTTDLSHLLSEISQGIIAFLTLYSLIKSIFFTKKQ